MTLKTIKFYLKNMKPTKLEVETLKGFKLTSEAACSVCA